MLRRRPRTRAPPTKSPVAEISEGSAREPDQPEPLAHRTVAAASWARRVRTDRAERSWATVAIRIETEVPAARARLATGDPMLRDDLGPPPVCNYPDWVAKTHYAQGAIVMYMGKAYLAKNANDGLDPTISTYYWSPYAGCTPPPPKPPPPPVPCALLDKLAPAGQTTFQATYDAMLIPTFQGRV